MILERFVALLERQQSFDVQYIGEGSAITIARVEELTELPVRCLAQLSLARVVWSISSAGHASRHPSE